MSQPYCVVIGYTWYPALEWRVANPGKPFVGLRLDPDDRGIWVICERAVDGAALPSATLEAVERAIESEDLDAGGFDDVFIAQARSIGQAHRVASRIVEALEARSTGRMSEFGDRFGLGPR
jgi:hypothetical protein